MRACTVCGGTGADPLSDNLNWLPCGHCRGTGNEPDAGDLAELIAAILRAQGVLARELATLQAANPTPTENVTARAAALLVRLDHLDEDRQNAILNLFDQVISLCESQAAEAAEDPGA
jgi:hypothetical protein